MQQLKSKMKGTLTVVLLTLVSVNCQWKGRLVFEENFNGNRLDASKWEYQEGCGNEFGSGNLQCYSRNNVAVRNGHLVITAKVQNMGDKKYTSGRIRQRGTGFAYGAYVVRARLARGDHLWPALWLFSNNAQCRYEEIDMAEYRGQSVEAKSLEVAAHWGKNWQAFTPKGTKLTNLPFDLSAGFHEYAVLWLPSKLEWYIDNTKYYEVSLTDGHYTKDASKRPCSGKPTTPFTDNANFIFNVGVGGDFFKHFGQLNPNTWTKPTMEIDWVRVYQG